MLTAHLCCWCVWLYTFVNPLNITQSSFPHKVKSSSLSMSPTKSEKPLVNLLVILQSLTSPLMKEGWKGNETIGGTWKCGMLRCTVFSFSREKKLLVVDIFWNDAFQAKAIRHVLRWMSVWVSSFVEVQLCAVLWMVKVRSDFFLFCLPCVPFWNHWLFLLYPNLIKV